jgi:hypothetical protein
MNLGNELYFLHPFISNSRLTSILPEKRVKNLVLAYALGTLVDAMITTPELVDFIRLRVFGYDYQFTPEQFQLCKAMRNAFRSDPVALELLGLCQGQQEFYNNKVPFMHDGFFFEIPCKVKFDLWSWLLNWGGEIKTTSATTKEQFMKYCDEYDYDRQAAFYMINAGSKKHMVIAISKVFPHPIFIHCVTAGDPFYQRGYAKITPLAYELARRSA